MSQKSYDFVFKLKAIDLARKSGNRGAAEELRIDKKRIRDWRKQEDSLRKEESPEKRRRLSGGGRKAAYPQMEEELAHWIENQRQSCMRVTRKAIARKAIALGDDPYFKAGRGWIQNFLKRFDFVI
jgi:hypothetical protein